MFLTNEEINENESIEKAEKTPMFQIGSLLKKFENLQPKKQIKEFQALADEIRQTFPPLTFASICGMCGKIGTRAVREIFYETIKGNSRDKLALFLYQVGEDWRKIIWKG